MRIRVDVDVTKTLICRKKFNIGLVKSFWLCFTYERLPDFYFCRGWLGHGHKECHCGSSMKEKFEKDGMPHGNWMRVGYVGGDGYSVSKS